jgi:hypothetical protein
MREALGYLRDDFAAPVPEGRMEELQAIPVSCGERIEHRLVQTSRTWLGRSPWLKAWIYHRRYVRGMHANEPGVRPLGILAFLQYRWKLERAWQIPAYATGAVRRRVAKYFARQRAWLVTKLHH